jgi:hypothetical protein
MVIFAAHLYKFDMTALILKSKLDSKKLDSLILFMKSWDIDVEIKTAAPDEYENGTSGKVVTFDAISIDTRGYKFNREEAHVR